MQRCFSGALSSNEVGACASGTQTCDVVSGSEWGDWGLSDCVGEVVAATETCDGRHADCDGALHDGHGTQLRRRVRERALQSGHPELPQPGIRVKARSDRSSDICEDAIDNDCDGMTNEGCDWAACHLTGLTDRDADGDDDVVGLSGFRGTLELREGEPSGLGAPTPVGPGMVVYGTGVLSGSGP